jgi:hypothetical protein
LLTKKEKDHFKDIDVGAMMSADEETEQVTQHTKLREYVVIYWLGCLIEYVGKEHGGRKPLFDPPNRSRMMGLVSSLQTDVEKLTKEMTRMVPISLSQLLQLMTDIVLILTPPSLAHTLTTARDSNSVYYWVMFGAMICALFYEGGMRIISSMEYPFQLGIDELRSEWILMASERHILTYLTKAPPDFEKESFDSFDPAELDPVTEKIAVGDLRDTAAPQESTGGTSQPNANLPNSIGC